MSEFCQFFDQNSRTSENVLIQHGSWFMVSSSVTIRYTQEGIKTHYMQLNNHDICVKYIWDWHAHTQYWAWHGCSMDLAQYRLHWQVKNCQAVLVVHQLALLSELGQHYTAWLGTMLARFGHVYNATANRNEPCWYHAGTVSSGGVMQYKNSIFLYHQDMETKRTI